MKIYFKDTLDNLDSCPEVFLKKASISMSYNDLVVRRHKKRFKRLLKQRRKK